MNSFKQFITEGTIKVHLEHLEDVIFDEGYKGAISAINFITSLGNMFTTSKSKSDIIVTIKYDGRPAILAGTDPSDGKFFVGTKSVLNKVPVLNKTQEDFKKNGYPNDLAEKLSIALKYFKDLGIDGYVLQGDLMFISDMVKKNKIDGKSFITFTPNTITYAVPEDSPLAKKIQNAKIGIVWHTRYDGDSLSNMKKSFIHDISMLKASKNVWFDDATFKDASGITSFDKSKIKDFQKEFNKLISLFKKSNASSFNWLRKNNKVLNFLKKYNNSRIRNGQPIVNTKKYIDEFLYDFEKENFDEIANLKTDSGKDKRQKTFSVVLNFVKSNIKNFSLMIDMHRQIIRLKNLLLQQFHKVSMIGNFIRDKNGFRVTDPEGFVAIKGNNVYKLVNRLEFSRINFNVAKNWVKG